MNLNGTRFLPADSFLFSLDSQLQSAPVAVDNVNYYPGKVHRLKGNADMNQQPRKWELVLYLHMWGKEEDLLLKIMFYCF